MTENKRFKMEFHDVSHDELEKDYSYYRVVESCISDNGEFMSYGQIETTLNELYDENKQIKHTIHEAYNNERTALGKSVLKQILDNVEGIK